MKWYIFVMLAVMGVSLLTSKAYADFYRWVDENGTIWLTDDPVKFPRGAKGEFERVMAIEMSPSSRGAEVNVPGERNPQDRTGSSAETFLEARKRRTEERNRLESTISTLEEELAVAQRALQKLSLTDRRGYWFVVDPQTGKRIRASYKDPGAIWSTQTWPAVPRAAQTRESDERRQIQADIVRSERDLERAKQKLFAFSRSF